MTKYKLIYFNSKGAAEATRILFRLAGQEFEDVRVTQEDWPSLKPTMPFFQLPVLEIDGVQLPQCKAIQRYVSRQFGFAGNTPLEEAEVDAYVYLIDDIFKPWGEYHFSKSDQAEKDRLLELAREKTIELLRLYEKKLGDKDYLIGSGVTLADILLMILIDFLIEKHPDVLPEVPTLKAHHDRITDMPQVKTWFMERPKTEF